MFPLAGSEFGSYIKVCDDIALTFEQHEKQGPTFIPPHAEPQFASEIP